MEHFGGVGSENKAPEGSVPVRRHRDQVDVLLTGQLDNLGGGVAVQQEAADVEAGQRTWFEGAQVAFGLFGAGAKDIHQHGAGDLHTVFGVQRRQYVGEDEFGLEVEGEFARVVHGESRALREIDGQEDLGKGLHVRLYIRIRRSGIGAPAGGSESAAVFLHWRKAACSRYEQCEEVRPW